jgi:hypothetical protein
MMNSIPQHRFILYVLIASFLPLVAVFYNYTANESSYELLHMNLSKRCKDASLLVQKERSNKLIHQAFAGKDPFYISKAVEPIALLQEEKQSLERISQGGFQQNEEGLRKRIHLLTSSDNNLSFQTSPEKRYPTFQETLLSLAKPVETTLPELQTILTRIEGVPICEQKTLDTRPHLIISDFKIDKKHGLVGDTYSLNMKIIQRDYGNK